MLEAAEASNLDKENIGGGIQAVQDRSVQCSGCHKTEQVVRLYLDNIFFQTNCRPISDQVVTGKTRWSHCKDKSDGQIVKKIVRRLSQDNNGDQVATRQMRWADCQGRSYGQVVTRQVRWLGCRKTLQVVKSSCLGRLLQDWSDGQVVARQYRWSGCHKTVRWLCCRKTIQVVRSSCQGRSDDQVVVRQIRRSGCDKTINAVRPAY